MARRLIDIYRTGDRVEVWLAERWQPAIVAALDFPGVWVEAAGRRWFVTNRRHIRPEAPQESANGL